MTNTIKTAVTESTVKAQLNSNLENDIMALGKLYMEGTFKKEETSDIRQKFASMELINEILFYEMQKAYNIKVVFTEDDMYKSAHDMRQKVMESGIMYIFSGNNTHKYFTPHGNLVFRAVHDILGHLVCGCPFSHKGEISAGMTQRHYYPQNLHALLFSEIGLQTSAFYYNGKDFDGIEQRAVELDTEIVKHFYQYETDYSKNSVLEPLTHLYCKEVK